MDPQVCEKGRQRLQQRVELFLKYLNSKSESYQQLLKTLIHEHPKVVNELFRDYQRFLSLADEKPVWYPEIVEQLNDVFWFYEPWGWTPFWLAQLKKEKLTKLHLIPYRQCFYCGENLEDKKRRKFHSAFCEQEYNKWYKNAREVGRKRTGSSKAKYFREQALKLYRRVQPKPFVSVAETAWKIAWLQYKEVEPHLILPKEPSFLAPELRLIPEFYKIVEDLLAGYIQTKRLPDVNVDNMNSSNEYTWHLSQNLLETYQLPK